MFDYIYFLSYSLIFFSFLSIPRHFRILVPGDCILSLLRCTIIFIEKKKFFFQGVEISLFECAGSLHYILTNDFNKDDLIAKRLYAYEVYSSETIGVEITTLKRNKSLNNTTRKSQ